MSTFEETTQFTQPTQPIEDYSQVAEPEEDELTQVRNGKKAFGKLVGRKGEKVFEYGLFINRPVVIGRHRTCNINVDSPISSNRHCRIIGEWSNGPENILVVCEDTSSNGTFLNGQKIGKGKTVMLAHGDTLEIKKGHYFTFLQTVSTSDNSQTSELDLSSKYQITDKILGSGTFAEVRLVLRKDTKEQLAVKIMEKRNFSTAGAVGGGTNYIQEINLLRAIDHANIVRVYDVYETDKHVYIFMPLVMGGDLFDYILSNARLPEEEAKFITYQILLALNYLHERNITHRDVKPENILIDAKEPYSRIMLTDFGMAKAVGQQSFMKTMCGTFQYIAPEIIQTNMGSNSVKYPGYSTTVDCWSLGVVVYAMVSGMLPFAGDDGETMLFRHILSGYVDFSNEVWNNVSDDAVSFIKAFLQVDPQKRMTIDKAFKHPWIEPCEKELATLYARRVINDSTTLTLTVTTNGNGTKENGGESRMSISEPSHSPMANVENIDINSVETAKNTPTRSKDSPEKRPNNNQVSNTFEPSRKSRRIENDDLAN